LFVTLGIKPVPEADAVVAGVNVMSFLKGPYLQPVVVPATKPASANKPLETPVDAS
jgi:hypothetical protein